MMFSSSNHINAFQTCSSSSTSRHLPFPLPLPFFCQETEEILPQQNYPDPVTFSAPFLSPSPQLLGQHVTSFPASNGGVMAKQETISCQTGSSCYGVSPFLTKKVTKKDRHSKIYTAQGLRDRRVRLSIEISRKFFDLQDLLGFDKASKTLEWLMTKSRKAIKELARTKQKSLTSGSEVSETEEAESNDNGGTQERPWRSTNKFNFSEKKCHLSAKESRAKARERARTRTMEKSRKSLELLHQLKPLKEVIADAEELGPHSGSKSRTLAEEFTATKRKLKSKGESFDNNNNSFYHPNLSQNWDINTAIARSSFCDVTNMNLSTDSSFWKAMGSIQQPTSTLISSDLPIQEKGILDEVESAKVIRSGFLKAIF